MNRPRENHAEHDPEDIWSAVYRRAPRDGAIGRRTRERRRDRFRRHLFACGPGYRWRADQRKSTGGERFDTIVWLDHRALKEADFCTATGHEVLEHSGHFMSPERNAEADVAEEEASPAHGRIPVL